MVVASLAMARMALASSLVESHSEEYSSERRTTDNPRAQHSDWFEDSWVSRAGRPTEWSKMLTDGPRRRRSAPFEAMLHLKKLDIESQGAYTEGVEISSLCYAFNVASTCLRSNTAAHRS